MPVTVEAAKMNTKQEMILLAGLCALLVLLSLAGLVWTFVAGLLYPQITMDGLLLALVCLAMGGVFTVMLLWQASSAGWLEALKQRLARRKGEASAPAQPGGSGGASQGKPE